MKLLTTLAFIGPVLGLVLSDTVCPPRPSMSILTPAPVSEDCDVCEELRQMDTDFYVKCGKLIDDLLIDKLVADCKKVMASKIPAEIEWFWEELNAACSMKSGLGSAYIKFIPPSCECDPCVQLANADSEFMQICAPEMSSCEVCNILCRCRQVKNDYEQLWLFYQSLKAECYNLTGQMLTFPLCDCDVCWLLFYDTSDFMQKCGNDIAPFMLEKLMSTCEGIMCDPIALGYFKRNLELVCQEKGKEEFTFPQCSCEECWLLFQTDSDFMQKCGSTMNDVMLMKLMETCYSSMDTLDHFMQFLANLEVVCQQKGNGYFKESWCVCNECLLLEDPTQEIWQDCLKSMLENEVIDLRNQCLEARENEEDYQKFIQDLLDNCYCMTGMNVTFPSCGCTRQDLCIELVVDGSGSINSTSFADELNFVQDLVAEFGNNIGADKTRIGIIQFSSGVKVELSLCDEANQADVTDALANIVQKHGGTNTAGAIEVMSEELTNCCPDGHLKYGIVLTDGWSSNATELDVAISNIPDGVTMIAIGFGQSINTNELLKIALNVPQNEIDVASSAELNALIKRLLSEIIPC